MDIKEVIDFLKNYDGPNVNIMEVCGSHTGAIAKAGIPSILSDKINLVSGPGCPVCVTPSDYIDKLISLSIDGGATIVTFGDLLRVPGSEKSLSMAQAEGAKVKMIYSPLEIVELAMANPEEQFIMAAVGFETTTPVYALLLDEIISNKLENVKLLTALKTMPEVIDYLCASGAPIQGFLAPGHVSVVTGSSIFEGLAQRYSIPFGVAGFEPEEILIALYGIVHAIGQGKVMNFYPSVVSEEGNLKAKALVDKYFEAKDACWRGMGQITGSGRCLKPEYAKFDAGSLGLDGDIKKNKGCCCDKVLMGKMKPSQCPLFGKVCTPMNPQGACMVSTEGTCFSHFSSQ